MAIKTTVGELLQLAIDDKTPKVRGSFEEDGATCFNGGIALALKIGPSRGMRVVKALNKVKIQADRIPRAMKSIFQSKGWFGLGLLSMNANDDLRLKKSTIARKLMETLTPEELAQPVTVVEPRTL